MEYGTILVIQRNNIENTRVFDFGQSSFPVLHKVGNVDIFVLLKFEKYDR